MLPTFRDKNIVGIRRKSHIKRFDLVYLIPPKEQKEPSIRRVIGLPGDIIEYKNDELFVNGSSVEESYLSSKKKKMGDMILTEDFTLEEVTGEILVPENTYFVLGDNRNMSTDSRYYGFVPKKNIIGEIKFRLTPLKLFRIF